MNSNKLIRVKSEVSLTKRVLGSLFFLSLAMISLIIFCYTLYHLIESMINHQPVIVFSQSPMYFLGCIPVMFIGFFVVLFSNKINFSSKVFSIKIAGFFLVISFIFPQIMDYIVSSYIKDNHYLYCKKASEHRARYSKKIYTIDKQVCESEIEKRIKRIEG
ncbi:hypothetical protein VA7868_00915 [Vibrio aerogenes CECT 7868]|uniref:DUF1240 domain-containing protein n=1 Tax=Vibrio aerogenes CECT 7868 TaxID=1216006 RepID=A0A1M5WXH0_9VIBR|nr:hypothetical protein VA7868_00915 [Vibrio aerogenes CECT 7868]